MHCIHHSRGRILFEVVCAFTISASCVGAWMQTGTSALLPASFAVALYGLWHLTDLAGRRPAVAGDAATGVDDQGDLLEYLDPADSRPVAVTEIEAAEIVEAAEPVEPVAPPAKPARKASGRRAKARKQAADVVLASPELENAALVPDDEAAHPLPSPLFEPEPFARQQQRAVFGRKAG